MKPGQILSNEIFRKSNFLTFSSFKVCTLTDKDISDLFEQKKVGFWKICQVEFGPILSNFDQKIQFKNLKISFFQISKIEIVVFFSEITKRYFLE